MSDRFFTQSTCSRCPNKLQVRIMSWFNNDTICMECSDKETVIKKALREKGIKLIIISASNANYREELGRWLICNGFYHFDLILKESLNYQNIQKQLEIGLSAGNKLTLTKNNLIL